MKRFCVLLCLLLGALLFGSGCGSQWNDFWADLRGDNQRMRSDFGTNGMDEQATRVKARD
jgi:hypothetical protein